MTQSGLDTFDLDEDNGEFADATVKVVPAVLTPRGVVAMVLNAPGADTIDWGDGSTSPHTGAAARHVYAAAKAYTVSAVQGTTVLAAAQVYVRDGLAPAVTFAPNTDNPNIVEATFGDDPADLISRYQVTWAADAVEEVVAPKGTVRTHGYQAGTYPIAVRDLHTGRALSTAVTVVDKEYDPDFTVAQGANTMTALLELTKPEAAGKEILIDWGDYEQTTVPANEAIKGYKTSHPYAANGDYIVQVVYSDGSTDGSARVVTIPFAARDGRGIGRP